MKLDFDGKSWSTISLSSAHLYYIVNPLGIFKVLLVMIVRPLVIIQYLPVGVKKKSCFVALLTAAS